MAKSKLQYLLHFTRDFHCLCVWRGDNYEDKVCSSRISTTRAPFQTNIHPSPFVLQLCVSLCHCPEQFKLAFAHVCCHRRVFVIFY